ncbi:RagB/SusD family nutrient uptake outer membrane protein [Chitinophaga arvensicola]|uniref:SusD family protein n=1 Tax=Chitinophaga arvensicola TaxID=29529 RepID=A0A1I0PYM6_9BACT|nr:RagB/SusD family nutrient uptake outer membrane protein [Chitinophaga arvensicola]SEW19566.1 SusD family protein [Chitinophaga arvensicola]
MKRGYQLLFAFALTSVVACNKQIDEIKPLTKITAAGELSTVEGIEAVTVGTYATMSSSFETYQQDMGESRGNNITLRNWGPPSKGTDAFFFQNSTSNVLGNSYGFYQSCYQQITNVNMLLDYTSTFDTLSLTDDQKNRFFYAKGENLFLRALAYFSLVRVYAKPYYQDKGATIGLPLKKTGNVNENPAPVAAKDIYAFIIADLQTAAQLMKAPVSKKNTYVSTAAAWALLSRVYLYMGGSVASPDKDFNQLAVTYADSVLNFTNGKYNLLQGNDYKKMFANDLSGSLGRVDPSGNKEVIFAIDNSSQLYGSSIGQMYHFDATYGTGGVFVPSADLKAQFAAADIRGGFFQLNTSTGSMETTKWLTLNYYTATRAPSLLLRLAEVYLNRAEANAKLANNDAARNDLLAIHTRAGLPASDVSNLRNDQLLPAILQERRLELAFEAHNSFDYFRNGLPLIRIAADNNGSPLTIQPDDPRVVFTIPNN